MNGDGGGAEGEGGGWERGGNRRKGGRGIRLVCKINKKKSYLNRFEKEPITFGRKNVS